MSRDDEDRAQVRHIMAQTRAFTAMGKTLAEAWALLTLNEDRLARGGTSPSRGWQIMAEPLQPIAECGASRWNLTCPDCGKVWDHVIGYGRWLAVGGWNADEPTWPDGLRTSPRASVPEGPRRLPDGPVFKRIPDGPSVDGRRTVDDGGVRLLRCVNMMVFPPVAHTVTKWRQCRECWVAGLLPAGPGLSSDAAELLRLEGSGPALHIALPPAADGTKRCIWCRALYDAKSKRWDVLCCSDRCRQNRHRRIQDLEEKVLSSKWGEANLKMFTAMRRREADRLESVKAERRTA